MVKVLNFSASTNSTSIEVSPKVRVAVSRIRAEHGGRNFVVKSTNELKKERKSYNTNLKFARDTLQEVEEVRVKSLEDITDFRSAVTLVNTQVSKHNNSRLKTVLKCLLLPWAVATIFKSNFFKKYESVTKEHEFSIEFPRENSSDFFEKIMQKIEQNDKSIVELDFSQFPLTNDQIGKLLGALRANTHVRSLILSQPEHGLRFDSKTIETISNAIRNHPSIDSISFKGHAMSGGNIRALGELANIKHLDLSNTGLVASDIITLQNALRNASGLKTLNLFSNALYAEGAQAVADIVTTHPTLSSLNVENTRIALKPATIWFGSEQRNLEGVDALATAIKTHQNLETIDLRNNNLGEDGCKPFVEALQENKKITWFDISENKMGTKVAETLGQVIGSHPALEHISLINNNIESAGILAISKGIRQNRQALHYIDLADNNIQKRTSAYRSLKFAVIFNTHTRRIRYSSENQEPKPVKPKPTIIETAGTVAATVIPVVVPGIPKEAIRSAFEYATPYLTPEPEDFWDTDPNIIRRK